MEPLETVVTCLLGLHDAKQKMGDIDTTDEEEQIVTPKSTASSELE